jgi:hypothetical protein
MSNGFYRGHGSALGLRQINCRDTALRCVPIARNINFDATGIDINCRETARRRVPIARNINSDATGIDINTELLILQI